MFFYFFKKSKELIINLLILLIDIYQLILSPYLGCNCKYIPTCSSYMKKSLKLHGLLRGGFFSFKRIIYCSPFIKKKIIDLVPPKNNL